MGLPKGRTNNPFGRKPGSQNKLSKDLRERIVNILESDFTPDKIKEDLEKLKPEERLGILIKLMDFAIPKLKQIEISGNLKIDELPYNGGINFRPRKTYDA